MGCRPLKHTPHEMTHPPVFWHSSCNIWPLDVQASTLFRNVRSQLPACTAQHPKKIDDLNCTSVLLWGLLSALFVCGIFRPMYSSVRRTIFCRRIVRFTFCCHVFYLSAFFTRALSPSLCPRKLQTLTAAFRYIVRIGYLLLSAGLGLWVCLPLPIV